MFELVSVYAPKTGRSWGSIEKASREANGLQTRFRFELSPLPLLDSLPNENNLIDELDRQLADTAPETTGIVFVDGKFTDKSVDERLPNRIYVSCRFQKTQFTPPLRLFALYQLASAALSLGLDDETNALMIHDPPIGCLWDWWSGPGQRSIAVITARICPQCQGILLRDTNDAEERIAACLQILDYVRRAMLGKAPAPANRIFVAYGASSADWKTLKTMLEGWGLEVEHFNRESVTGLAVSERWRQMLDQSRFAFAVMTPDTDGVADEKRASQNVIHEIGLCHARLGVRNTAILVASDADIHRFTNIEGIQRIKYEPGRLDEKKAEIEALLVNRGLLDRPKLANDCVS